MNPDLYIVNSAGRRRSKSRRFGVNLLGLLEAPKLLPFERLADARTPILIVYWGSEAACAAFTANLRAGREASLDGTSYRLPRRARFRWHSQRLPGGVVTMAYLPELFELEPPPRLDRIRFVLAPPSWWILEQASELARDFPDAEALEVARAALLVGFLDRRTHLPIVNDLRFHLQLFHAAKATGWLHQLESESPLRFRGRGLADCRLDTVFACDVEHPVFASFLAEQTALYRQEVRCGTTRIA